MLRTSTRAVSPGSPSLRPLLDVARAWGDDMPMTNTSMTTEQRRNVDITEEQFDLLWANFPDDPVLIGMVCRDALRSIHVPIKTGRWSRYDVRVYLDDGPMGSGYLMVHWDDSRKVPNCLDNGYCTDPHFRHDEITWDDQPERERLLGVRRTLMDWAYSRANAKAKDAQ